MSEHTEQSALFEWAAWNEPKIPALGLLFAVPNGGARHIATAIRMRAEGCRAGVWDCLLPVARGSFIGVWIEMKVGKNNLTLEQARWGDAMRAEGYACYVCYSWMSAARLLCEYLGLDEKEYGL